jgi:hypothetical protein
VKRLEFKFRESAPPEQRKMVVDEVARLGANKVEQLFPDEKDPELASMYKAEGVPDDVTESVVSKLDQDDAVEFAETTPERKLIR